VSYALIQDRLVGGLPARRAPVTLGQPCPLPAERSSLWYAPVLYPNQLGIAANDKEIMGDIPNYTDIAPQIQISEVVVA
jgi:hypothetical protein